MANTDFEKSKEWEVSGAKLMKAHGFAANVDQKKAYEDDLRAQEISYEILKLSRSTLMINLRFLESAFLRLVTDKNHSIDTLEMATDGNFLYYNPVHIVKQFNKASEIPTRDYLHVILHCVFRHLFIGKKIRADVWDLACDIAVENIITNLKIRSLYADREADQAWVIKKIEEEIPKMSAEWIYKYFMQQDSSEEEIEILARSFHADDHSIWHNPTVIESGNGDADENEPGADEGDISSDSSSDMSDDNEQHEDEEGEDAGEGEERIEAEKGEDDNGAGGGSDGEKEQDGDTPALKPEELEKAWKDIAERIEIDLETSSDTWGEGTGDLIQNLKEINKEKYDYTRLLKRFSVLGENVEINDDEFDYIFYTYGMNLYNNMPLVEPLEYKDVKKVREFVIALDTSESVSGDIVQKFVTKTWNILKQSENFFTRVNVHIIQCGARVEEDVRITTQDEFDEYMRTMVLKGFGGTDFRPVFEHVDTLLKQHEFTNLKGLIYFTDGFGTFPVNPPLYDAAFIFLDQGYDIPEIPVWAIKMMLKEEEIIEF